MKTWFSHILVAGICLTLGYLLHPLLNIILVDPFLLNEITVEKELHINFSEVLGPSVAKIQKTLSTTTNCDVLTNVQDDVEGEAEAELDEPSYPSESRFTEEFIDDNRTDLQNDLAEWMVVHKEHIDDLVTAYMPAEIAELMKIQIMKDNDFLNKPELKQDSNTDDNWSYTMQQELRRVIENHELGDKFEVLNLACKQLVCDILGIEKEAQVWAKIHIYIMQNVPLIDYPTGDNDPKSLVFMVDDVGVVYFQIRFKSG
ncbi:hypothetical protein QX776_18175 [Alteromonadaceae bacterium BrNp21-10]|nr:hypothetical protein [Alteromonadaceae bacterium BrNp21-10]